MSAPSRAIVAIPASNEAERLPSTLASLAAQRGFDRDRRLPVLVLANNCRDDTVEIAASYAASPAGVSLDLDVVVAEFAAEEAHVGTARRRALDLAAERIGAAGVLLTTDADARLPQDWVSANLAALRAADIVGGRLVIDAAVPDDGLAALHRDIERYWSSVRAIEERLDPQPHDPAPRHGDHTGASLALRVATYRAVGGVPPLPRGEDNALVARVVEAGGRLRHHPDVSVRVSDRALGPVRGGMATDMARRRAVLAGAEQYLLPEPAHWCRLIARRAWLRAAFRLGPDAADAALLDLGLPAEAIAAIGVHHCPNDIAFVERAHRQLERGDEPPAPVPLGDALAGFDDGSARR